MKYAKEMSSQVVGLRYFNVYGPNEQHKTGMTSPVYNARQIEESVSLIFLRDQAK